MPAKIKTCGRCGAESEALNFFRSGGNAKREKLCGFCRAEAKANRKPSGGTFVKGGSRGVLTPAEIAADNARWERVFSEKFADPHYYTSRLTAQSSFGAFALQMETIYTQ